MSTRFIDTSPITPIAGFPFRGVTLDHLKTGNDDAISSCCISIIGKDYAPSKHHIMSGCVNSTPAGPAFTISAGYIFSGGILYKVDATTFTPAMGQTAVCVLDPTYNVLADPTIFEDGSSHSVHVIRKIKIQSGASGSGLVDFANLRIVGMEPFREIGTTGNPSFQNGFSSNPETAFFLKDFSKNLFYLGGRVKNASILGGGGVVIFTSPYIPSKDRAQIVLAQHTGGFSFVSIYLLTTGDFVVHSNTTLTNPVIYLDGVCFFLD